MRIGVLALLFVAATGIAHAIDFTPQEVRAILRHGPWPAPWRPDPTNRVSGNPDAITLGEKLFFEPLSQIKQSFGPVLRLVIVVDALDECEREGDIRNILHLFSPTQHLKSICVRIFLTSRPELPICLGFKKMSSDAHQDVVLQEIPQTIIEDDISIFLKTEFTKIRNDYNFLHALDFLLVTD